MFEEKNRDDESYNDFGDLADEIEDEDRAADEPDGMVTQEAELI